MDRDIRSWRRHLVAGALCASSGLALCGTAAAQSEENLMVYFGVGSTAVGDEQTQVLDEAARLYREGSPIVMILAGGADTLGPAAMNLALSVERAQAVLDGLVARGIPVERLQVAGRGETDLEVATEDSVAERRNRYVEITWR